MHGVINFDKPGGMTSQTAVTLVKRALGVKKAGHAGTLDPMATGVLIICIGEATKISSFMMDMPKTYEAELKFGQRTDTLDAEGQILEERDVAPMSMERIGGALEKFKGLIHQVPPMYSALKKDGKPLYELARKGIEVERKARQVTIYGIEALGYEHPFLRISVSCSKGTYVRTLAEDIATELGTVAHLSALRRTRVGGFSADEAVSPETVSPGAVVPVDSAIGQLREVLLSPEDFKRASNGGFLKASSYGPATDQEKLRLKDPTGGLFAIGGVYAGRIKVDRMLHLRGQT